MYNNIRGVVSFSVSGGSTERFLNEIRELGVACFDIRTENGVLTAKTYRRYFQKIRCSAEKNGLVISIISEEGLVFKTVKYKKRYGLIVGMIIVLSAFFILSNHVVKIEISGNYSVDSDRVEAVLEENGVTFGKFIPDINTDYIKQKLTIAFDEFSWVGVRTSGGRFIVEVTESTPKPFMVPENQVCNIVSDRDAQIKSIEVYSGDAVVRAGDGVSKGQLLISGIDVNKNNDARYLRADGKIIATYTETAEFFCPLESNERTQIDEKSSKALRLWGISIPLSKKITPEGDYELDESTTLFSLGGLSLPIGITHKTYRFYAEEKELYTPFSAKEKLRSECRDYEEIYFEDKKITEKNESFGSRDNGVTLCVEYKLESEIGLRQNIIDTN